MINRDKPSDEFSHRVEILCDDPFAYDYYENKLKKSVHKSNYEYTLLNKYRTVYMIIDFKYEHNAITFKLKYL